MDLTEKIRALREANHWSQEAMAEKMNMSKNGYAKIERGENRPNLDWLPRLAEIFTVDVSELLNKDSRIYFFVGHSNSDNNAAFNYYASAAGIAAENEQLKRITAHKEALLSQQKNETDTLKALIAALQHQIAKDSSG